MFQKLLPSFTYKSELTLLRPGFTFIGAWIDGLFKSNNKYYGIEFKGDIDFPIISKKILDNDSSIIQCLIYSYLMGGIPFYLIFSCLS